MSFVHLHCHSEYSLLDGANRIEDLIARARELEQPALAITDHGNMHAAWEFQEKARKAGIKPLIGMEAYVAPGDRRLKSRPAPGMKPYYHLVLLARDLTGYRNLVKLSSLAYTEGFYVKPRMDRELLAQYSEGLVVSSACLAGEVATHLMEGRYDAAKEAASWYAELFRDRRDVGAGAARPGRHPGGGGRGRVLPGRRRLLLRHRRELPRRRRDDPAGRQRSRLVTPIVSHSAFAELHPTG